MLKLEWVELHEHMRNWRRTWENMGWHGDMGTYYTQGKDVASTNGLCPRHRNQMSLFQRFGMTTSQARSVRTEVKGRKIGSKVWRFQRDIFVKCLG